MLSCTNFLGYVKWHKNINVNYISIYWAMLRFCPVILSQGVMAICSCDYPPYVTYRGYSLFMVSVTISCPPTTWWASVVKPEYVAGGGSVGVCHHCQHPITWWALQVVAVSVSATIASPHITWWAFQVVAVLVSATIAGPISLGERCRWWQCWCLPPLPAPYHLVSGKSVGGWGRDIASPSEFLYWGEYTEKLEARTTH